MTNEERQYIIMKIIELPLSQFKGTVDDLFHVKASYFEDPDKIDQQDEEFLERLYEVHVQVIGECFTCFSKTNLMRLIKMSETTIRIICDPCRENLHSAKNN